MAEPVGNNLIRRSEPSTAMAFAPATSLALMKRPLATSKLRTGRNSDVAPKTAPVELRAPACTT